MPRLIYRRTASADLAAILRHIAADNPYAARAFVTEIRRRCAILAEFPRLGRERPDIAPGLHIFTIDAKAAVAYRPAPDGVIILRVFTAGQDFQAILGQEAAPDNAR